MRKYAKYVNLIVFVAAASIFWISFHYTGVIIGYFQLGRKLGSNVDYIQQGVALLSAALTFMLIFRNTAAMNFLNESVHELVNVSWPSDKEVRLGTIVVIITVILSGLVLGVLDIGLQAIIKTLLGA